MTPPMADDPFAALDAQFGASTPTDDPTRPAPKKPAPEADPFADLDRQFGTTAPQSTKGASTDPFADLDREFGGAPATTPSGVRTPPDSTIRRIGDEQRSMDEPPFDAGYLRRGAPSTRADATGVLTGGPVAPRATGPATNAPSKAPAKTAGEPDPFAAAYDKARKAGASPEDALDQAGKAVFGPDLTDELSAVAGDKKNHNAVVRGLAGTAAMATGAIQHPINTTDALLKQIAGAPVTVGRYIGQPIARAVEPEAAQAFEQHGADVLGSEIKPVTGKDAALAGVQTALTAGAPLLERVVAAPLERLIAGRAAAGLPVAGLGKAAAVVARAVPGAAVGASFDKDDPLAGAIAGGVAGGAHAAVTGAHVNVPAGAVFPGLDDEARAAAMAGAGAPLDGANAQLHPEKLLAAGPRPSARVTETPPAPTEPDFSFDETADAPARSLMQRLEQLRNAPASEETPRAATPAAAAPPPLTPEESASPLAQFKNAVASVKAAQDVVQQVRATGAQQELVNQRDVARRAAETHPLTGLGNDRAFARALPAIEADPTLSVGSLDINGFKNGQDHMPGGHLWGDQQIQHAGAIVQQAAADHGVRAFHPHGDEFAFAGPTDRVQAAIAAAEGAYGVSEHAPGVRTSLSGGMGSTFADAEADLSVRKQAHKTAQGIGRRGEPTTPTQHDFADLVPDDEWIGMNRYVVDGTQASAAKAAASFATSPARPAFISHLRQQLGDQFTVYRAGAIKPGEYQSFTTDPTKAAHFGRLSNSGAPTAYRVNAADVAFPGSGDDAELVIRSDVVQPTTDEAAAGQPNRPKASTSGATQVDNAPAGGVRSVPLADLDVEPQRFQYKLNTDEKGVTRSLSGVKAYNPDLAGVITAWRDPADGRLKVINGHHRIELAQRHGVRAVDVREIQAPDAATARATGALINIAEGHGTAIDAAKQFRDTGTSPEALERAGVPLTGAVAKDGLALAQLHPALFDQVVSGKIPVQRAAVIGASGLAPEQQLALSHMLDQRDAAGKRLTNEGVSELIRFVKGAGSETTTQDSLFGAEAMAHSLAPEKADLSAYIKDRLSKDRRLFGFVAKGDRASRIASAGVGSIETGKAADLATQAAQTEEVYNKLSSMSGPVSDALTAAARALVQGGDRHAIRTQLYDAVSGAVQAAAGGAAADGGGAGARVRGSEATPARERGVRGGEAEEPPLVDPDQAGFALAAPTTESQAHFARALADPSGPEARALDAGEADAAYGSVAARGRFERGLASATARIRAAGLQSGRDRARQVAAAPPVTFSLLGADASTPEALRIAATVLRHPRAEHFSYVLRDRATGRVREHVVMTSGMLNYAITPWTVLIPQIADAVGRLGGPDTVDVLVIHNHPAGFVLASPADLAATRHLSDALAARGISLAGHLILDHDHANWLTVPSAPDAPIEKRTIQVPGADADAPWATADEMGEGPASAKRIAAMVRDALSPNGVTLFYLDRQHRIVATVPVSPRARGDLRARLERERSAMAANTVVLAVPRAHFHETVRAVEAGRVAGEPWAHYVLDVLQVSLHAEQAPEIQSAVQYGVLNEPSADAQKAIEMHLGSAFAGAPPVHERGDGGDGTRGRAVRAPAAVRPEDAGGGSGGPPGLAAPDLFGNPDESDQQQGSLFSSQAGTPESRNLKAQERAAQSELDTLRMAHAAAAPHAKAALARRIGELEKFVNRDRTIAPDELARQTHGEGDHTGADMGDLFGSPTGTTASRDDNPFREQAEAARRRYQQLVTPTAHDAAMATAFPVGAGYGRAGGTERIDASVRRATHATDALRDATHYETLADGFDRGDIDQHGRAIDAARDARGEAARTAKVSRAERIAAARAAVGDKEAWQVPAALWADAQGHLGGAARELSLHDHQQAVEQAHASGKLDLGAAPPPSYTTDGPDEDAGDDYATGIKNATAAQDRADFDLGARSAPEPRTQEEMYAAGKALADADPGAERRLMQELEADPEKIVGSKEQAGLLLKMRVDMDNRLHDLIARRHTAHANADAEGERIARLELAAQREEIGHFIALTERTGTATARALAARKMMSSLDYDLSTMEYLAEAAKGAPLTDAELERVKALYDELQVKLAAAERDATEAKDRAANAEAELHHAQLKLEVAGPLADRITAKLDHAADAAMARLKARGLRVTAGMDPIDLADHAIIGAAEIARGARKFADWSDAMVRKLGASVKPHLEEVFTAANATLDKELASARSAGQRPVRPTHAPVDIHQALAARVDAGIDSLTELQPYLRQLALGHIRAGITARPAVLAALQRDLQTAGLDVSDTEVRDALSGYGDFHPLDRAADKTRLREIQAESQKLAQLEALGRGQTPLASGFERQPANDETRQLTKQVNAAKKAAGIGGQSEEARLKTALESAKTRTRNAIKDLQSEIDTGTRIVKGRTVLIADRELTTLRAQLAHLRETEAQVFGKPGLTDAQRLSLATAAAQRSVTQWQNRLAAAMQGAFATAARPGPLSSPELDALRAHAKAAQAQFQALRALDPNERRLKNDADNRRYRARLAEREADLLDKIARADYRPRPLKPGTMLDRESIARKADVEAVKQRYQEGLRKFEADRAPFSTKAREKWAAWVRAGMLSYPTVIGKLTSIAAYRTLTTPMTDAVALGVSKALPGLAKGSGRYSASVRTAIEAEARAHAAMWTQGIADAKRLIANKRSDLDLVHGKEHFPPSLLGYFGQLHGALKAPVKQAEYTRSLYRRTAAALVNGEDVSDPMVQLRLSNEAFLDGERAISMQDSPLVNRYNRFLRSLEETDKATKKGNPALQLLSTAMRTEMPIVKVPVNIVKETSGAIAGSLVGPARAAWAYYKGIEDLKPVERDAIIRLISAGFIGLAFLALGFFKADSFGGFYQPGEKRKPTDLKAGQLRAFGHTVPAYLDEHPFLWAAQFGATIRRVADSRVRKSAPDPEGFGAGVQAAGLGLLREVPFSREVLDLGSMLDPKKSTDVLEQKGASLLVPGVIQWVAQKTDSTGLSRPHGMVQHLEYDVPGLRHKVEEDPTTLQNRFRALPFDAAMQAFDRATPREKSLLTQLFEAKIDHANR